MKLKKSEKAFQYPQFESIDLTEPCVELVYKVFGSWLPADHGYGLFGAIANKKPEIRKLKDYGILTIPGFGDKRGKIALTKESRCRVRVTVSKIPLFYQLVGETLKIGIHSITLGTPEIYPLKPSSRLRSRIVVISNYQEPDSFLRAVQDQLEALEVKAIATIPPNRQGEVSRKTIKVKTDTKVGFSVHLDQLSDEDSIKVQRLGIGGKRHMGCGFFQVF